MSAGKITDAAINGVKSKYDFILINYANPDMIGHTGNFEATASDGEVLLKWNPSDSADVIYFRVYRKLETEPDESLKVMVKDKKRLPALLSNRKFTGRIALRIPPDLHKRIAVRALQAGESINKYIQKKLDLDK